MNGIRIKLQTNANNIDPSKLNQIDPHLSGEQVEKHVATENNAQNEPSAGQTEGRENINKKEQTELMEKEVSQGTNGKLISDERVEQSKNKKELNKTEPVKKETEQKKQIVPQRGQFGLDITNKALPDPPVSQSVTVTEKKDSDANLNTSNEVNSSEEKENYNTESEHIKVEPIPEQQIKKSTETCNDYDTEIQGIIKRAQDYVKTAIILSENESREKPKTFDEIFYETVIAHYYPECPETFTTITESVFEAVFLQDIPEKGKRLEEDVLNVLKKFGLEFNRNYLIKLVDGEKLNLQHFNKHSVLYKEKSAIRKLYDEFRSYATIYIAQKKARKAIKNNNNKTRDAILTELIQEYSNQDSSTFTNVVDVVLYEVFCNGKDPNQIETLEEVFYALRALEVQFNEEYLESRMRNKKDLLYALVREQILIHEQYKKDPATSLYQYIYIKPADHSSENEAKTSPSTVNLPTGPNTRLELRSKIRRKLMLENIFYSPETYFCLFSIVAFISTLYLWHFPPIWMAVLKESMPSQKKEDIGSVLNIGLPILIVLCIANLVHFIYSEYSGYIEFVEQENARNLQPSLEL